MKKETETSKVEDSTAVRPLRADARRNRDALLATACEAFRAGEFDLRMEEIAARAGVGVGTLYRHFETRNALIEELYAREVDALCASATDLLSSLSADEALYAFFHQLMQHLMKNCGLFISLMSAGDSETPRFFESNRKLEETLTTLMNTAAATSKIRSDVTPQTVMMAMGGICATHGRPRWEEHAKGVVALLIDGLRLGRPQKP